MIEKIIDGPMVGVLVKIHYHTSVLPRDCIIFYSPNLPHASADIYHGRDVR